MKKIAICTPTAGMVHACHATTLFGLLAWQGKYAQIVGDDLSMTYLSITGSVLAHNQRWLVEQSLALGADYILFLEDDMNVRPEALSHILTHDQPIVGATYPKRLFPIRFICHDLQGEEIRVDNDSVGLVESDHLGMGFTLIKRQVFEDWPVSIPWFSGECADKWFCHEARKLDFPSYVDLDASRFVEHEGQHRFSWLNTQP